MSLRILSVSVVHHRDTEILTEAQRNEPWDTTGFWTIQKGKPMTRRSSKAALLFVIAIFTTTLTLAQTPNSDAAATPSLGTQLEFIGQEPYEMNGTKGTRYKLSVTNRASHPDFLWRPTQQQAPCGKNQNASRTWVEVFGSPGDKRLAGFCGFRSSEDLGHLWFGVPSGEKGPPCVYIVLTDRQTGKKYESNRVCSRSFTVARGSLSAGGQQQSPNPDRGWIEINSWQTLTAKDGRKPESATEPQAGLKQQDASGPTNKIAKMAQPDLTIKQFLFPPTNDKALRVHVVNTGKAPSAACRLFLTVRKINGVAAGRQTHVTVPAMAAGADAWLHINAKSILPDNVSLQSTTFKLIVDATAIVAESNEANNEVWHNQ